MGAGGSSAEVARVAEKTCSDTEQWRVVAFVVDRLSNLEAGRQEALGRPIIEECNLEALLKEDSETVHYLFCGMSDPVIKQKIVEKFNRYNVIYPNFIHETAVLDSAIKTCGVYIGPFSMVSMNCWLGNHVHVNPQCGIGHDSRIGDFSSLLWNVTISGNVMLGERVVVGSKACIRQGLDVGDQALVGMGAVVVRAVPPNVIVAGNPARIIERKVNNP